MNSGHANQPLAYCKLCEYEDFDHPEVRSIILDLEANGTAGTLPHARRHRKSWEIAMAIRGLRDFGAVRDDADILGVAAGVEQTIFWLTRYVRRVVATDLYDEETWGEQAPEAMLTDPGRFARGHWDPSRLDVLRANALKLPFEGASFDGVFSSGSIEHFGGRKAMACAAAEMSRVLKPGGIAAISTEFRLRGPRAGLPGTLLVDLRDIERYIVGAGDWELVHPVRTDMSERTKRSRVPLRRVMSARKKRNEHMPHLVLTHYFGLFVWTSVAIVLRKLGSTSP